jgi:hypothetical protein
MPRTANVHERLHRQYRINRDLSDPALLAWGRAQKSD